jgi:hypothetical protein
VINTKGEIIFVGHTLPNEEFITNNLPVFEKERKTKKRTK